MCYLIANLGLIPLVLGGLILALCIANWIYEASLRSNETPQVKPKPEITVTELSDIVLPELSQTLGDRIVKCGAGWMDESISEKLFPFTLPGGPRELVLVNFGAQMLTSGVEDWAAKNGYESAWFEDIIALGTHPGHNGLSRRFRTVVLRASIRCSDSSGDSSMVVCLKDGIYLADLRKLGANLWQSSDCFLMVRKT